jgi:SpoVK/Ycf46/Vps4 family AAA+-type ATPase
MDFKDLSPTDQKVIRMIDSVAGEMAKQDLNEGSIASRWCNSGPIWWPAKSTADTIPPGTYRPAVQDGVGPCLMEVKTETDNLIEIDDSISKQVVEEFRHFWTLKDLFTKYGFLHKRGYLFHGPAGSGKSSTIFLMLQHIIREYKGIGLYIDHPEVASAGFQIVRRVEPSRPIIAVMEDLDALIHRYGEANFLSMLDGEAQVDNIVFVGTTNYMEALDKRITNRPSRFDRRILVDLPNPTLRAAYFRNKVSDVTDDEVKGWVARTEGYSFAHLREFIVGVRCFRKSIEDVVKELDKMNQEEVSSDDYRPKRKVGF